MNTIKNFLSLAFIDTILWHVVFWLDPRKSYLGGFLGFFAIGFAFYTFIVYGIFPLVEWAIDYDDRENQEKYRVEKLKEQLKEADDQLHESNDGTLPDGRGAMKEKDYYYATKRVDKVPIRWFALIETNQGNIKVGVRASDLGLFVRKGQIEYILENTGLTYLPTAGIHDLLVINNYLNYRVLDNIEIHRFLHIIHSLQDTGAKLSVETK